MVTSAFLDEYGRKTETTDLRTSIPVTSMRIQAQGPARASESSSEPLLFLSDHHSPILEHEVKLPNTTALRSSLRTTDTTCVHPLTSSLRGWVMQISSLASCSALNKCAPFSTQGPGGLHLNPEGPPASSLGFAGLLVSCRLDSLQAPAFHNMDFGPPLGPLP